jgi:hypothetical protein
MMKQKKQVAASSLILIFSLAGLLFINQNAVAQSAAATHQCDVVHDAFKKSFQAGSHMTIKNTGTINVTEAQGKITEDGSYTESCKFIRDENLNGEATSVYSEVMKSSAATADGKIWISKTRGLILQQDVNVDMNGKGKGEQIITFAYKK